jgi:hypothetical protein
MPYSINRGDRVEIAWQFTDSAANIVALPAGVGMMKIAYTALNGSSAVALIPMATAGYTLVAAWASSVAALGTLAFFSTVSPGVFAPPDNVLRIALVSSL